jgi:L-fuculose-phosphate aldolase
MNSTDPRQQIIDTCRALEARGLNQGTSGNISLRDGDAILITPSSLDYGKMVPDNIVRVDVKSGTVSGSGRPSSELPLHLAIHRSRPDALAVVHTHSHHATAISCMRRDIPAVHYLVGLFGGADIRCASYATFGTEELSANVVAALAGRRAALMANHGLVVIGRDLPQALSLVHEAETLARLYLATCAASGQHILPAEEMARIVGRFREFGYGPVDSKES